MGMNTHLFRQSFPSHEPCGSPQPRLLRFCPARALGLLLALSLALLPAEASAQKLSLSTNLVDYANFGTLNLDISYAVSRNWSVMAGAKYNPFSFRGGQLINRQRTFSLGARWWPWHIYSGFWLSGKAQYMEFGSGGIFSPKTSEGDAYGMGLGGGYSHMLGRHINLEAGLGFWGGFRKAAVYDCPVCGTTREQSRKAFIMPNDIILSVAYVF